jgi:hypothetical protein
MRAIGRAANVIVDVVLTAVSSVLYVIGFGFFFYAMFDTAPTFWAMIDPAHLTSLSSIFGVAALVIVALMVLAAVGTLDQFDWLGATPKGGGGEMRRATRDDLRAGGILGRR